MDGVAEGEDPVVERVVHRVGVRDRVRLAQQVGPTDRPDEQRTAAEQRQRALAPSGR